jgi:NADPH-dependent 7-cyano-7-deazaguanine reductase QueF
MIVVKYTGNKLDTVLKKRLKEYFHSFKNNNQNKFSQHILENNHSFGKTEDIKKTM